MNVYFTRLYEYNAWANDLFSEVLLADKLESPKPLDLFSHIGNAQIIWFHRVTQLEGKTPKVFDTFELKEAIDLVQISGQLWLDLIKSMADFDEMIEYQNSKGESFQSNLSDIIIHVANHGTHHRGQIATLLRQENIAPPASDFIFFTRA
uniref:DinB family protein n=1 Tax=Roseivirga sp. TaxID=1964215 RepID=UPI0040479E54